MQKSPAFLLSAFVLSLCALGMQARNVTQIGDMYFLLDQQKQTATVTCRPYYSGSYEDEKDGWMYFQPEDLYIGHLVIPDTVEYGTVRYAVTGIGDAAFANSQWLISLHLPAGIRSIGVSAFSLCYTMEEISVAEENETYMVYDGVLYERSPLRVRYCPYALSGEICIKEGMTEIESSKFQYCKSLVGVILPEGIEVIRDGAFDHCTSLESVYLPTSLKKIERRAFSSTGLTSIMLPPQLSRIDDEAFLDCTQLYTIYNSSPLVLTIGSKDNGYVAYYAQSVIEVTSGSGEVMLPREGWQKRLIDGEMRLVSPAGVFSINGQKME